MTTWSRGDTALISVGLAAAATGGVLAGSYEPKFVGIGVLVPVAAYTAWSVLVLLASAPMRWGPPLLALCALVLVRLPLLYSPKYAGLVMPAMFLAGTALCGTWSLARLRTGTAAIVAAYALLLALTIVRGGLVGTIGGVKEAAILGGGYAAIALFGVALFATAHSREDWEIRLLAVALAPGVYALANMVMHLAGFSAISRSIAQGAPAQLLNTLGIHADRVVFPLAAGINNFGVLCGVGLTASAIVLGRARPSRFATVTRWAAALGLVGSAYCLLYCDSRLTLFFSVTLATLVIVMPRLRVARGAALLVPISPLVMIAVLGWLAKHGSESLSRNNGDAVTGSSRTLIWRPILEHLAELHPHDLVGYGAGGQVASGLSKEYAYLFAYDYEQRYAVAAHNAALQAVLDAGFLGLALLVAFFVTVGGGLGRLARLMPRSAAAALLAGVVVVILGGFTEVSPSYYSPEVLVWLLLAAGAATAIPDLE